MTWKRLIIENKFCEKENFSAGKICFGFHQPRDARESLVALHFLSAEQRTKSITLSVRAIAKRVLVVSFHFHFHKVENVRASLGEKESHGFSFFFCYCCRELCRECMADIEETQNIWLRVGIDTRRESLSLLFLLAGEKWRKICWENQDQNTSEISCWFQFLFCSVFVFESSVCHHYNLICILLHHRYILMD